MRSRPSYVRGTKVLGEGKTKILFDVIVHPNLADTFSKNDITAGDGKKHDVILGKGRISNETACNIFRMFERRGIPTAFVEQSGPQSFVAQKCLMFLYEIVIRREARGSHCERYPEVPKGTVFPEPVVEFFLKTKDRNFKGHPLVCDDPFMLYDESTGKIKLYDAHKPMKDQPEPFLILDASEVFVVENEQKYFPEMIKIALDGFLSLEDCFRIHRLRYVDYKCECGLTYDGRVVMADLIDSDSGRLLDEDGNHLDKQFYRDNIDMDPQLKLDMLMKRFKFVAEITSKFCD